MREIYCLRSDFYFVIYLNLGLKGVPVIVSDLISEHAVKLHFMTFVLIMMYFQTMFYKIKHEWCKTMAVNVFFLHYFELSYRNKYNFPLIYFTGTVHEEES